MCRQNKVTFDFFPLAPGTPPSIDKQKLTPTRSLCDDTLDSIVREVADIHGDIAFIFQIPSDRFTVHKEIER
jgi:hypothetical protein